MRGNMKKYQKLRAGAATAAAACMFFTACGGKQTNTDPAEDLTPQITSSSETGITPEAGFTSEAGLTPEAELTGIPDGTSVSVDSGGDGTEEETDEERAEYTVVYDEAAGYLMYQGIYYEVTGEDTVQIPDYYDIEMTELVIPDTITYEGNTYRVTRIAEDAFSYYYDLARIVLGNNVEVLEDSAFMGCSDLTEVIFGTGLKEIGAEAFAECDMLTAVDLPEGVTTIGEEAFCSCVALESIRLPSTLLVLGENMFFDCTALKSVSIPASVETIPYGLFTNCEALETVELAEGLLVIEEEAFWACEELKTLVLPESLVYIGDRAFYSSGFESMTFPDKRISVGDGVFDFCEALTTIYVSENTAEYYEGLFEDYMLQFETVN